MQKVSGIGGSERHLLSLLPALAEAGVEVRMCVAATGRPVPARARASAAIQNGREKRRRVRGRQPV